MKQVWQSETGNVTHYESDPIWFGGISDCVIRLEDAYNYPMLTLTLRNHDTKEAIRVTADSTQTQQFIDAVLAANQIVKDRTLRHP